MIKEDVVRFRLEMALSSFPDEYIAENKNKPIRPGHPFYSIFEKTLEELVEERLILEFGRKNGWLLSRTDLDLAFEKKRGQMNAKVLEAALKDKNLSFQRWKGLKENEIQVQEVMNQSLGEKLFVSVEEMRRHYRRNRQDFRRQEQVRVRHIVTDSAEKARDLHKRLQNGENFAKLAVNHSQSPDRKKGGDLGFFAKGSYPQEFDDVCFRLEKGEISSIVKSSYGYHIFKLIDKRPAGFRSFSEVMTEINNILFQNKLKAEYQTWIGVLKEQVTIKHFHGNKEGFVL